MPLSRDRLFMWILLGLLAFSLTNLRGWIRGVVLEWIPFALILWAYDHLRGQADGLLFSTNVHPQLRADEILFGGTAPTVWLQEHLWDGSLHLHWYDYATWVVYVSYFLATYLVAGVLWFFARGLFRRFVAMVSLLAFMGFATYALFPAAPPWMASDSPRSSRRSARSATSGTTSRSRTSTPSSTGGPGTRTRSRPCRRCTRPTRC